MDSPAPFPEIQIIGPAGSGRTALAQLITGFLAGIAGLPVRYIDDHKDDEILLRVADRVMLAMACGEDPTDDEEVRYQAECTAQRYAALRARAVPQLVAASDDDDADVDDDGQPVLAVVGRDYNVASECRVTVRVVHCKPAAVPVTV